MLVNPGSVGQTVYQTAGGRDVQPTWAEYGLLAWNDGALSITLQRVPYSKDELSRAVRRSGMPRRLLAGQLALMTKALPAGPVSRLWTTSS